MSDPSSDWDSVEAPPIMGEEPVQPPVEPKSYIGISILTILLLLAISGQLLQYFGRKTDPGTEYAQYHAELKSVMIQSRIVGKAPTGDKKEEETRGSEVRTELDKAIDKLSVLAPKDLEAAALVNIFRYERKLPVDQEQLKRLAESKTERYKLVAEVYAEQPPALERAKEISKKLSESEFAFRWAGVHALERAGDSTARANVLPDSKIFFSIAMIIVGGLGIGLGIITLIAYFYMRASGTWKPKGHPAGQLKQWQADNLALRAAQMLVTMFAIELAVSEIVPASIGKYTKATLGTVLAIVGVVIVANLPFSKDRPSLLKLCLSNAELGKNILWGVGGAVANLPLLLLLTLVSNFVFRGLPEPEHPITVRLQTDQNPLLVFVVIIAASIGAPIMEEFVFRGAMLPAVVKILGKPVLGTILINLAFAALHPTGIPSWPALAMLGITSSVLANMRGSLVPSMTMHAVHNLMTLLFTIAYF